MKFPVVLTDYGISEKEVNSVIDDVIDHGHLQHILRMVLLGKLPEDEILDAIEFIMESILIKRKEDASLAGRHL